MLRSVLEFLAPTLFLTAIPLAVLVVGWGMGWVVAQRPAGSDAMLGQVKRSKAWRWVTDEENRISVGLYVVALVLLVAGFLLRHNDEWGDLAPEMISTAVAISVLDLLFNLRGEQREKSRVISQMGATDSTDVALAALAVVRAEGWLRDGALKGANLQEADL